jgi:hypothetical protein
MPVTSGPCIEAGYFPAAVVNLGERAYLGEVLDDQCTFLLHHLEQHPFCMVCECRGCRVRELYRLLMAPFDE